MSAADPGLPQDGPNPLELFFEKNKKWIYALAVILVASLGRQIRSRETGARQEEPAVA